MNNEHVWVWEMLKGIFEFMYIYKCMIVCSLEYKKQRCQFHANECICLCMSVSVSI